MPDNVRALRGNPGGRPTPSRVKAPPKPPAAPTWLDTEAKAEWRRVVPELNRLGVLALIDRAVLATYCSAWSKFVALERVIQTEGFTAIGYRGEEKRHPSWAQWRESATVVATLGQQLFVTPNSRLRSVKPEESDDGEDDILD